MGTERDQTQDLSPLKRALFAVKDLRGRLDAIERARVEPIAIVGMACRFPGAADLESYWRLLEQGIDAIREVPRDRWDVDAYYDPDPDAPGKTYSREGGFLDRVDGFDAAFFGIPPREVVSMDPQQRLLLEVTWEALENAGMPPPSLAGTATGVFVGIGTNDYTQLTIQHDDPTRIDAYMGTGGASCVAAGRISYVLGLHGPAMAIDTACSSSLVAIDLAVQQLRAGRCQVAIAGGVNVILSPTATVYLSKVRALSPSSRCKAFDASADGYVRGEGCGMVVLKRLSDAERDGDVVLAVVRGSATNHDGRSSGLTVPNGQAQQAVIRQALADAGVAPSKVHYIEAHGTGTPLGDPIELRAMGAVLGEGRTPGRPFLVGTVKTNIGHLEAAAGVAGLIKVVLAMRHRTIPPSLHFREPNPHVPWQELPVAIPTACVPWPGEDDLPVAGISAYGFSGTNAHVIVEAAPAPAAGAADGNGTGAETADRPSHVLALSAPSVRALRDLAGRFERFSAGEAPPAAADVAFSANTGRAPFEHRLAVVGDTTEQLAKGLQAFVAERDHPLVATGRASAERPKIAFLFTGQGSQYVDMGRELYETEPAFRASMQRCDAILGPHLDRSLLSVLYPGRGAGVDGGLIDQTAYTQPALFALEYALAELWRSWGVEPAFVMGHSVGEYVAACVAGLFGLEDGLRLIATRARLMQSLPAGGRMAAVFAAEDVVAAAIRPHAAAVSIAAINGAEHVVISGAGAAIEEILGRLSTQGVRSKPLTVSHAFHSPLMEPILDAFEQAAAGVAWTAPKARIVSNLTGAVAAAADLSRGAYWRRHLREPVRFAASIAALAEQGCAWFLEVGPHPTLLGMAGRCVPDGAGLWLPSLRKGARDWQQMLKTLGTMYVQGAAVDWRALDRERARRRVSVPTYPFQRDRYWIQTSAARRADAAPTAAAGEPAGHPLLGQRLRSPSLREHVFQLWLSADTLPFVRDHVVFGMPVFPATAYAKMARAGGHAAFSASTVAVEELAIEEPLALGEGEARLLQIAFTPLDENRSTFQVFSRLSGLSDADGAWTRHAAGRVAIDAAAGEQPDATEPLDALRRRCVLEVDVPDFYARLRARGVEYGPTFRGIEQLWQGTDEAVARLRMPEGLDMGPYGIHPAFLDTALQVLGATVSQTTAAGGEDVYLPVGIAHLRQYTQAAPRLWSYARLHGSGKGRPETLTADLRWFDDDGRLVWAASGITMKRASSQALRRATDRQLADWLYEIDWQPVPASQAGPSTPSGAVLICADNGGAAAALAGRLDAHGVRCVTVTAGSGFSVDAAGFTVDPANRADFDALFRELRSLPLSGIVHLWGLDEEAGALDVDALDRSQARTCGSLLSMVQALGGAEWAQAPRLWMVTRGAVTVGLAPWPARVTQAPLWGLARVIALEQPQWRPTVVDLDPGEALHRADQLAAEIVSSGDENQLAYRGGSRYAARLVRRGRGQGTDRRLTIPAGEGFRLTTTARGVLDNLTFEPRPRQAPGAGEVEVRVHAAGLNFRDVLNALGMYPGDPGPMGGECAGRIVAVGDGVRDRRVGEDVLCLAGAAFGKSVVTPQEAVVPLPSNLTYEQGAGIPVAFLTAHYGLHHLARIKKGDRVLVHAAAGGVGQAATQIALRAGAEVYGTAGSPEKREFVRALGVRHVFSSRAAGFADELMALTGGHGVDIVLNSLTGAFIPESLRVLAPGGCFLEIGKAEIWDQDAVAAVNPNVSYRPFDLAQVMLHDIGHIAAMFSDVIAGMRDDSLRPLPLRVFDFSEATSAFRFMAQAKHVGKVVLSQRELIAAEADSGAVLDPEASYLITGGAGGLGLKVAEWMVNQGARRLVLTSRSAPSSSAVAVIHTLQDAGATVDVVQGDISRADDARRILADAASNGRPLRGIIHAAGVLDDGVLTDQSWARFERVMAPKVRGSWLLHDLTRGQRLDFFVMFSSTSSVLGAPGQGNYAAANAFMDALAQHRRAHGEPALSINWGAWADVGMAARLQSRDQSKIADRGIGTISPDRGVRTLGLLLQQASSNVVAMPVRWSSLLQAYPAGEEPPILRVMAKEAGPRQPVQGETDRAGELRRKLRESPVQAHHGLLLSFVRAQVARVLGLENPDQLDPQAEFNGLGLDSLMVVELRNALAAALGQQVPASLFFEHPTIEALTAQLVLRVGGAEGAEAAAVRLPSAVAQPRAAAAADLLVSLDRLSEDQIDSLLTTMLASRKAPE